MSFWPEPFTEEQSKSWIERAVKSYADNDFGRLAVVLKSSGEILGDCGIMRSEIDGVTENDLGYIIYYRYWNSGYASEAAKACIDYGFNESNLQRITANMGADNIASAKTAEKIGMRKEKEFFNKKNRGILTYLYSITKHR
jgi:ribosomal-protein-alanine N-acetyltransferase